MSYFFKFIANLVVSALIVSSVCGKELKKLEIKTLFHDNKNVIGQPITYPSGSPLIISELITFPAGHFPVPALSVPHEALYEAFETDC